MLPIRFLLGSSLVLSLFGASVADAMPPLAPGDLIGWDIGALRRLDGPPSSENVFSGRAFNFKSRYANLNFCAAGEFDVEPDGDVIAWDGLRDTLVRIDLDTGAWHIVSGLGIGTGPAVASAGPLLEPSGSILQLDVHLNQRSQIRRTDAVTGDRSVFLEAPVPPTEPGQFAEFDPRGITVRSDGTIAMYSVVTSTGVTQARLFDVDPNTAVRTPILFLDPTIDVLALAATDDGDALLLSEDRIRAVNSLGVLRTVSGDGVGTGPALDLVQAFATNGSDALYAVQRSGSDGDVLISIDPTTGDRELIVNPNAPVFPQDGGIFDIEVAPDGSVLAIGCGPNLIRIDPVTGVREVAFDPLVGSGPVVPTSTQEISGQFLAIDPRGRPLTGGSNAYVLRIEPTTGERVIVSGPTVGSGPSPSPASLAVGADGHYYAVKSQCGKQIVRIDSQDGDRTIVSENGLEPPYWFCPHSIASGGDGFLYVVDLAVVHRVDAATGARSILSDSTHGSGPLWPSDAGIRLLQQGAAGKLLGVGGDDVLYEVDLATGDRSIFYDVPAALPASALSGWGIASFAVEADGTLAMVFESSAALPGDPWPRRFMRVDPSDDDVLEDTQGFYGPVAVVPEPASALAALVAIATLGASTARRNRL